MEMVRSFIKGLKVVRGRDWKWGDQDEGAEYGICERFEDDWLVVSWYDKNHEIISKEDYSYRIGHQKSYDLYRYEGPSNNNMVTELNIGLKVVRGRDWKWDEQDRGSEYGVIIGKGREEGWARVCWYKKDGNPTLSEGSNSNYRIGYNSLFDLYEYTGIYPLEDSNIKIGDEVQCISIGSIDEWAESGWVEYDERLQVGQIGIVDSINAKRSTMYVIDAKEHYQPWSYPISIFRKVFHSQSKSMQNGKQQEGRSANNKGYICEVRRPDSTISTGERSIGTVISGRASKVRSETGHRSYRKISS